MHSKINPQKVDAAQLVLDRDVVDDELLIQDQVTKPHERDREVFASTAVAVLSCEEQSLLVVPEYAGTKVDDLLRDEVCARRTVG